MSREHDITVFLKGWISKYFCFITRGWGEGSNRYLVILNSEYQLYVSSLELAGSIYQKYGSNKDVIDQLGITGVIPIHIKWGYCQWRTQNDAKSFPSFGNLADDGGKFGIRTYGKNPSGCEKANKVVFLLSILDHLHFFALIKITICFKHLKASHILSCDS